MVEFIKCKSTVSANIKKINNTTFCINTMHKKNNKVRTYYNIPTPGFIAKLLNENALNVKGGE